MSNPIVFLSVLASDAPYKTASHAKPTRAAKSLSMAIAGNGTRDHQRGRGGSVIQKSMIEDG